MKKLKFLICSNLKTIIKLKYILIIKTLFIILLGLIYNKSFPSIKTQLLLYKQKSYSQPSRLYNRGKYFYNRKKYKRSIFYLRKFIKINSPIKDYGFYLLAWSYYKRKNYNKAIKHFSEIQNNYSNSRFYLKSIKNTLDIYIKLKKYYSLKKYLDKIKTKNKKETNIISYYYGIYFESKKNNEKALINYNKALKTTNKKQLNKIIKKIENILYKLKKKNQYKKIISNNNLINLGKEYYKKKQYKKSIFILASTSTKNLKTKIALERLKYILLSCIKIKEYKYASKLLKKMLPQFKGLSSKIELLYLYYNLIEKVNAKTAIKGYKSIAKYKHPMSIKANIHLANYYHNKKDYLHLKYLNYLASSNQEKIIWKYFITELNKKRFSYILRFFPKIIKKLKNNKAKAKFKYWLGIAAIKLKNYRKAEKFFSQSYTSYKYNYYSYKSLLYIKHYKKKKIFKLNINNLIKKDKQLNQKLISKTSYQIRLKNSLNLPKKSKNHKLLKKALYFYKTKQRKNFKLELERFLSKEKNNSNKGYYYRFLSEFFKENKNYQKSIHYCSKLIKYINANNNRNYIPKEIISLYYPKYYKSPIFKHSNNYKVNPYLVLAVIREESRFNIKARSFAGARGLMQIMPRTGRYLAKVVRKRNYSLYNVNTNIKLGTYYLSKLIKQFNSYSYALAAYNGGPTRMKKRLVKAKKNNNIINGEHIIELIRNNETRNYVKKVFTSFYSYMDVYKKLAL